MALNLNTRLPFLLNIVGDLSFLQIQYVVFEFTEFTVCSDEH